MIQERILSQRIPSQQWHPLISLLEEYLGYEVLASSDCRSENIRVLSIVVAELKLSDVERHIFAAHFMERSDYTALEYRPKAFDGLSMDCSDDVLAPGVVHSGMRI